MSEIKSIIVFGPTGNTGLQILKRGILEGLEVTAYVKRPQEIPTNISGKLHRVIQGDVRDEGRVEGAIEGHDAVLSAIGMGWNFSDATILSDGCRNIVAGMKKHNVTKLAIVSTSHLLPGQKPFFMLRRLPYLKDHERQLEILKEEKGSIEWIAMMAPKIKSTAHVEPEYKVEKNKLPGAYVVTTGELADFMVKVFMDRTSTECFRHTMLGISSHPKMTSTRGFKIAMMGALAAAAAGLAWYYGLVPAVLQEFFSNAFPSEKALEDL